MHVVVRTFWLACLTAGLWGLALAARAQAPAGAASATPAASPKPLRKAAPSGAMCSVAEFRTLALDTHSPQARDALVTQWLLKYGPACSEEQIAMIRANRALWLGTADTAVIMGLVDRIVEARQSGRPDALQSLYAPLQPERAGALEVHRVQGGMRPVVPAPAPLPPMALGVQVPAPGTAPMTGA
ncbi:MAG: hypothetical protein FJY36_07725, partial [Betaproteobacteria bacterium]|nr:hypothetical protein [Betaproteobacteria bacterium]